ncbi:ABC transporter ATP-binding protein [Paenibacillus peoriae]|uniref:ABC transporter ATP-binding protein n=1 Tax=Paenibacillus peoriae TaxID=59893 RepID=UPI00026C5E1E|nr:ABC transporter ATP-binding protein [Paenibacillus peoriae]MEC0182845.1 ABC transporter ATP-binding protein [Paenibacillus peoriae]
MTFSINNAVCGYSHKRPVLRQINFSVETGEVICILGANGAGKSTLFKSILGLIPLLDGSVTVDGANIAQWSRAEVARTIGYIPQANNPPFSYSVLDVILMGRTAHLGVFQSPTMDDEALADEMMAQLGIEELAGRRFLELSGGQKQLVMIARALIQQPRVLIMDEPTAALDFGNQQLVLQQVSRLSAMGLTIIMASHFPDHAFLYSHKVLLIKDGGIYASGPPDEVITEDSLRLLYKVDSKIVHTGITSRTTLGTDIKIVVPLT